MGPSEGGSIKRAFWCRILEGETPSAVPGHLVRTVRGLYTTPREPAKKQSAARAVPGGPLRQGERPV